MEYCLKFKITNLSNTVFDVHDISSIRGSSHAALNAPNFFFDFMEENREIEKVEKKFEGGSQIIVKLSSKLSADEIEKKIKSWWFEKKLNKFPLKYLQYVVAILPWENEASNQNKLLKKLEAICSFKKNNIPSVVLSETAPASEDKKSVYCEVDNLRPYFKTWSFNKSEDEKKLSKYIYKRRSFGVKLRPIEIYKDILSDRNYNETNEILDNLKFSQSFEEIVSETEYDLPVSLKNKMAVVFMDINGLGKLQRAINSIELLSKFSNDLQAQRKMMLNSILRGIGNLDRPSWVFGNKNDGEGIRFETLLWGADESSWVMPSWLAMDFMSLFFDSASHELPTENNRSVKCSYSVGMVICNQKMPIRQARNLANELRESAKSNVGSDVGSIQIEILEGIDIPSNHLNRQRTNYFGSSFRDSDFTVIDSDWKELLDQVIKWKRIFPKSQLHKLLAGTNGIKKDQNFLQKSSNELYQKLNVLKVKNNYDLDIEKLQSGPLAGINNSLLIALYNLERYWDYTNPILHPKTKENARLDYELENNDEQILRV